MLCFTVSSRNPGPAICNTWCPEASGYEDGNSSTRRSMEAGTWQFLWARLGSGELHPVMFELKHQEGSPS